MKPIVLKSNILGFGHAMVFLSLSMLFAEISWGDSLKVDTKQLIQLSEYIAVDYSSAVSNGEIIDQDEYQEMLEFSALIVGKVKELSPSKDADSINKQAWKLSSFIEKKGDPKAVNEIANALRDQLLLLPGREPLPTKITIRDKAISLYADNCSSCHGASGNGDGVLSKSLSPSPTDFTDVERAKKRSVLGLYDVLSEGIAGTSMLPFKHLDKADRWALAFYIGSMASADDANFIAIKEVSFENLITQSVDSLQKKNPSLGSEKIFRSRIDPTYWLERTENPLELTRNKLDLAVKQYRNGLLREAKDNAVSAYLDGFELAENSLDAHSPELRKATEKSLMKFRQLVAKEDSLEALEEEYSRSLVLLAEADYFLAGATLSNGTLFFASLIIILREGLEALLVVMTLATVLMRSRRKDALKYVHAGWIAALVAGGATWWATRSLIAISGASREVIEGGAALFAAVILFYVGYWMHGKAQVGEWQKYIKEKLASNLSAGTLWGITILSFVAVYREVFETILFYQSLVSQAGPEQNSVIVSGLICGALSLVAFGWLFISYSKKLPIAKFLSVTTYILLGLSFILIGKGIAALQEAGVISISQLPVDINFSWLGIYSSWEGVLVQLTILLFAIVLVLRKPQLNFIKDDDEVLPDLK